MDAAAQVSLTDKSDTHDERYAIQFQQVKIFADCG